MIAPKIWIPAGLSIALALAGCGARQDEHGHAQEKDHAEETAHDEHDEGVAPAEHGEEAGEIRVPIADLRGLAFTAVGAPQEEGVWAPAEAVSDPASTGVLTAPAPGVVRRLLVGPGREVRAGEALAEFASAEIADLAARWRVAGAQAERARIEVERERALLAADATSRREVEAAEAAVSAAVAEAEAAEQSLAARGVDPGRFTGTVGLRAPVAGTLEGWEVAVGQGVDAGATLATIRDREATRVRVELAPPRPADWTAGVATEVRRGDGTRWAAVVDGLPAGLTPETRRYPYLLRLEGGPFPAPGTPLEVRVPLARGIVVPQESLQLVEGEWGVFVRDGDDAVFRPVQRGAELGGDVLLLGGLEPGTEIATAGAYLLRPLWMKRMGGGEQHAH